MQTFLDMGGYGTYVWPCYGLTVVVLGAIFVASLRALRADQATLEALQQSVSQATSSAESSTQSSPSPSSGESL